MNTSTDTRSQTTHRKLAVTGAAALLVATLGLAGCGERQNDNVALNNEAPVTTPTTPSTDTAPQATPGTTADAGTTAATPDRSAELRADAERAYDNAKQDAKDLGRDASSAARDAADVAGAKVADARITTSVNAELAKDKALSAMSINVDTENGRVALKGTAPTPEARERATVLASAVDGVVSVDNQLTVEKRGTM